MQAICLQKLIIALQFYFTVLELSLYRSKTENLFANLIKIQRSYIRLLKLWFCVFLKKKGQPNLFKAAVSFR